MRWYPVLLIPALACGGPLEPRHVYAVTVRASQHSWTRYQCAVRVSLQREGGDMAATDSVTVGAGEQKELSLLLSRRGSYAATIYLRWEGRPASSWDLVGTWEEVRQAGVPGNTDVQCP